MNGRGGVMLAVVVWCGAGCSDRSAQGVGLSTSVLDAPVGFEAEEEVVVEVPSGTVWTIVTALAANAPAGALDVAAVAVVSLDTGQGEGSRIEVPLGGSGVLVDERVNGPGVLRVQLLDPRFHSLGTNEIEVSTLGATLGVLFLELAPSPEHRGCLRCSAPEALIPVRGLHHTALYWSADSEVMSPADGSLHIAFREAVPPERRGQVIAAVGGHLVSPSSVVDDQHLSWVVVAPQAERSALEMAFALAQSPEVAALEAFADGVSGRLVIPLASADDTVPREPSEPTGE